MKTRLESVAAIIAATQTWDDTSLAFLAEFVLLGPPAYVLDSARLWTHTGAQAAHGPDPRNGTPDMARANADVLRAYRTIGEVRGLPFPAPGSVFESIAKVSGR